MSRQALNGVMHHLRQVAALESCRTLTDGELLERFAGAHEEAAFTALIERHGPMVLGVCRRALADFHDAEDACQATFLVLARKASSIRKKASLGSWLHGVACRAAARLKRDHARRKAHERAANAPMGDSTAGDPAAEVSWREMQAILDFELGQLPERYRAPLILCYLECLTREEAARQLRLSVGSLHGRLERARSLLRQRLGQRGLTLSAVLLAGALGEGNLQAALAPTFVVTSTRAALAVAVGKPLAASLVSAKVVALTQEVLQTMLLTKWKLVAALMLGTGLFLSLADGCFTALGVAQDRPAKTSAATSAGGGPATTESDADFIRRISKDLRGAEPSPAEVHFFVANKDAGKRQKLIDLFIQERQAKSSAAASAASARERLDAQILEHWLKDSSVDAGTARRIWLDLRGGFMKQAELERFLKTHAAVSNRMLEHACKSCHQVSDSNHPGGPGKALPIASSNDPNQYAKLVDELARSDALAIRRYAWRELVADRASKVPRLQQDLYKALQGAKDNGEVARITQSYLDRLVELVQRHPDSADAAEAMRQIVLVYESQGKLVEANAWRARSSKKGP